MTIPKVSTDEIMSLISILNHAKKEINRLPQFHASVDKSGYCPELKIWVKGRFE